MPPIHSVSSLIEQAEAHLAKQAYRQAHAACIEALKQNPKTAAAFHLLGIVSADHGNHSKAIELYDRALAINAQLASTLAQKARSLIALNRRTEAIETASKAEALRPTAAYTLDTLGVVLSRAGLHERALPLYVEATSAMPEIAAYHYNYAVALQFLGRMPEARVAYRRSLELDPNDARAFAGYVQITKQTAEANEIEALIALFPRYAKDANAALQIGHAIAKAYEDIGNGTEALNWLKRAKALKQTEIAYRPELDETLFKAATAPSGNADAPGFETTRPIFVVGMPRTGTTLVDRILSSHSELSSAGELTDFALIMKQMAGTPGPYVLDADTLRFGSKLDAVALGKQYIERVEATLSLPTPRFIDKMPLNIFYVPHILRALPQARIICLRRHPADTVLSNYRQLFATSYSYYNYAYDLETTANYYVQFDQMVRHFETTIQNDQFCVVAYEDVVANIEDETRRLLEFCDLPFEQQCVDFHQNAAPVATASSAQVRQPLYTTALARWKRYRPGIDAALDILVSAGCMTAAELES